MEIVVRFDTKSLTTKDIFVGKKKNFHTLNTELFYTPY